MTKEQENDKLQKYFHWKLYFFVRLKKKKNSSFLSCEIDSAFWSSHTITSTSSICVMWRTKSTGVPSQSELTYLAGLGLGRGGRPWFLAVPGFCLALLCGCTGLSVGCRPLPRRKCSQAGTDSSTDIQYLVWKRETTQSLMLLFIHCKDAQYWIFCRYLIRWYFPTHSSQLPMPTLIFTYIFSTWLRRLLHNHRLYYAWSRK